MELELSLGDGTSAFGILAKNNGVEQKSNKSISGGFCMALGINNHSSNDDHKSKENDAAAAADDDDDNRTSCSEDTIRDIDDEDDDNNPLQLDLLPIAPVPRSSNNQTPSLLCSSDNGSSEDGSSGLPAARGFDVNMVPTAEEVSSPNSVASSFQMDFSIFRLGNKRAAGNGAAERGSDEDDNGLNTRKKLRLSKEQSAYLEETFKEHNTLNPKQKLALAKQLNLRPRQVEVWFQNRRARTKLKQTEVDCEYLKRCCDTLTEENRRLHKELQELRALKTSNPFHMQLPATTLTMCPSCERVATTSCTPPPTAIPSTSAPPAADSIPKAIPFPLSRPIRSSHPFSHATNHPHQPASS